MFVKEGTVLKVRECETSQVGFGEAVVENVEKIISSVNTTLIFIHFFSNSTCRLFFNSLTHFCIYCASAVDILLSSL